MKAYVYDTDFNLVAIVDRFETFIWTDRYAEWGDFELYTPITDDAVNIFKEDFLIKLNDFYK